MLEIFNQSNIFRIFFCNFRKKKFKEIFWQEKFKMNDPDNVRSIENADCLFMRIFDNIFFSTIRKQEKEFDPRPRNNRQFASIIDLPIEGMEKIEENCIGRQKEYGIFAKMAKKRRGQNPANFDGFDIVVNSKLTLLGEGRGIK